MRHHLFANFWDGKYDNDNEDEDEGKRETDDETEEGRWGESRDRYKESETYESQFPVTLAKPKSPRLLP